MFTILRVFNGINLPVPTLPVDSLNQEYTFDNIKIQTDVATESLAIVGASTVASFNGEGFPLSGANYLTAVTSTLTVRVITALPQGLYRFPFVSQTSSLFPVTGFVLHGGTGFGIAGFSNIPTNTSLLVQSFEIPGITLPSISSQNTVPTVSP